MRTTYRLTAGFGVGLRNCPKCDRDLREPGAVHSYADYFFGDDVLGARVADADGRLEDPNGWLGDDRSYACTACRFNLDEFLVADPVPPRARDARPFARVSADEVFRNCDDIRAATVGRWEALMLGTDRHLVSRGVLTGRVGRLPFSLDRDLVLRRLDRLPQGSLILLRPAARRGDADG